MSMRMGFVFEGVYALHGVSRITAERVREGMRPNPG